MAVVRQDSYRNLVRTALKTEGMGDVPRTEEVAQLPQSIQSPGRTQTAIIPKGATMR